MRSGNPGKKHGRRILWGIILLCGCATSGYNKGQFNLYSIPAEANFGAELASKVDAELVQAGETYSDPEVNGYLQSLGQKLVAAAPEARFQYSFSAVKTPEVNAFALPAGRCYVNTGLIAEAENEAELAGVMAHEIGHVVARHGTERLSAMIAAGMIGEILVGVQGEEQNQLLTQLAVEVVATGGFLAYSRVNENEADQIGAQILYRAGYDPYALARFFLKLKEKKGKTGALEHFLSTHPDPGVRREKVRETIAQWPALTDPVQDTPEFERIKAKVQQIEYPPEKE